MSRISVATDGHELLVGPDVPAVGGVLGVEVGHRPPVVGVLRLSVGFEPPLDHLVQFLVGKRWHASVLLYTKCTGGAERHGLLDHGTERLGRGLVDDGEHPFLETEKTSGASDSQTPCPWHRSRSTTILTPTSTGHHVDGSARRRAAAAGQPSSNGRCGMCLRAGPDRIPTRAAAPRRWLSAASWRRVRRRSGAGPPRRGSTSMGWLSIFGPRVEVALGDEGVGVGEVLGDAVRHRQTTLPRASRGRCGRPRPRAPPWPL